jgi:phage terminase large subunit
MYCHPGARVTIAGQTLPHLRRGVLPDLREIIHALGWDMHFSENKTSLILTYILNGSYIELISCNDIGRLKGLKRDILFINEANHIAYDAFEQLDMRTSKYVFLDYNPDCRFWLHKKVIPTLKEGDFVLVKSTYKDNPFLSEGEIKAIERIRLSNDENKWKVYGEGELGEYEGHVFKNYEVRPPPEMKMSAVQQIEQDEGLTPQEKKFASKVLWYHESMLTVSKRGFDLPHPISFRLVMEAKGLEYAERLCNRKLSALQPLWEKAHGKRKLQWVNRILPAPNPQMGDMNEVPPFGGQGGLPGTFLGYGLDFGFHSATALVGMKENGNELWVWEIFYKSGYLPADFFASIKDKIDLYARAYGDSASPQFIAYLNQMGWKGLRPCEKGGESIVLGLQKLMERKLIIVKPSDNLQREIEEYEWDKEADGSFMNYPKKGNDHAIDAMRYVINAPKMRRVLLCA